MRTREESGELGLSNPMATYSVRRFRDISVEHGTLFFPQVSLGRCGPSSTDCYQSHARPGARNKKELLAGRARLVRRAPTIPMI